MMSSIDGVFKRPLVTFALFAFNQEKYIREAVEGAFAQTYEPLEIVLSDDCSTDRTFEIMREMAAVYDGPHDVRVRQNAMNLGTIDHLIEVATEVKGELLVVAAGDDISIPTRSEVLAQAWLGSDAMALYSNSTTIDDFGTILDHHFCHKPPQRTQSLFAGVECARRYGGLVRNIPGYSAAYTTETIKGLPKNRKRALNEDALTTILINICGGHIEHVSEPLLKYRLAERSTSTHAINSSIKRIALAEKKASAFSKSSAVFYPYVCKLLKERTWPASSEDVNKIVSRLETRAVNAKVRANIWELSFFERVVLAINAGSTECRKIVAARLLGMKVFCIGKFLYNYFGRNDPSAQ